MGGCGLAAGPPYITLSLYVTSRVEGSPHAKNPLDLLATIHIRCRRTDRPVEYTQRRQSAKRRKQHKNDNAKAYPRLGPIGMCAGV